MVGWLMPLKLQFVIMLMVFSNKTKKKIVPIFWRLDLNDVTNWLIFKAL